MQNTISNLIKAKWVSCLLVLAAATIIFLAALRILGSSLYLLVLAACLAYLAHPLVRRLEFYKINRNITVLFVFTLISALFLGLGLTLIPLLIEQIRELTTELPNIARSFLQAVTGLFDRWAIPVRLNLEDISAYVVENFQELLQNFLLPVLTSSKSLLSGAVSALTWLMNLFLFPVFFFFLIQDYEKLVLRLKEIIPSRHHSVLFNYAYRFDQVLAGYLRGQMIVCSCLTIIYSVGFSFLGIRFGFLLGLFAGALSLIPYVGFSTALVGSVALSLAYSAPLSVYIGLAVLLTIEQILESFFLTPRLVGNRVGLNTLSTILVLIAGANLAGFLGLLLAVPVGGCLKILLVDLVHTYKTSAFYRQSG